MQSPHPTVFISYARDQESRVVALATRLRLDGIEANIDRWLVQPGERWSDVLAGAIRNSNCVIVVLSRQYSEQLKAGQGPASAEFELTCKLAENDGGLRIIPIKMGFDVRLPPDLRDRHILDFSDAENEAAYSETVYVELLNALLGHSNAPPVGTVPAYTRLSASDVAHGDDTFVVRSIDLDHFRGTEYLRIHLEPPRLGHGQWVLLLGENGAGKSSVLWAMAMALGGSELIQGVLSNLSAELVHSTAHTARINVSTELQPFECTFRRQGQRTYLASAASVPALPLFAYGVTRGSALGGSARAVELDRPIDAVGTLFNLGSNLIHAQTWLRDLEHGALKGSTATTWTFEAVSNVLLSLLPGVDEIEIATQGVLVRGPRVGECTLASLSDGYLTAIGWVLDMIARWSHCKIQNGHEIPPNFNEHMTGIVLIDELDLHLHPRWQSTIVADLRKAFPRMTFVATTHNPLALLGADTGEVHVLRNSGGELDARQIDLPPGIRADQVLTGEWFGLTSTLDKDTQAKLEEHRQFLRGGADEGHERRRALELELRSRLTSFADTSEDRAELEAAARDSDIDYLCATVEQRKALRARLRDKIQQAKSAKQ
ncbi:MAG: TIR domain-containing protein [Gammaproteobacteria bacterium]|nr:TIR domain-containing protein [Gammaproteobacteria bacterium]